jgi:hypothetical protein
MLKLGAPARAFTQFMQRFFMARRIRRMAQMGNENWQVFAFFSFPPSKPLENGSPPILALNHPVETGCQ